MPLNYLQGMAGRFGMGGRGIDPRRRLAEQLMAQGVDTSPAYLGTGIGRLGKALAAAYMMRQSMGQETDAMKWLTAKMPDRMRQPTEEEAYGARPDLDMLLQQSLPTADLTGEIPDIRPEYGPGPKGFAGDYQGTPDVSLRPTPDPDSVLMGMGQIPETRDKIDRYTAGLTGESGLLRSRGQVVIRKRDCSSGTEL